MRERRGEEHSISPKVQTQRYTVYFFLWPTPLASLIHQEGWKVHFLAWQLPFYKKVRFYFICRWLAECRGIFLKGLKCHVDLHRGTMSKGIALMYELQKKTPMLSHCPGGRNPNLSISVNGMIDLPVAQVGLLGGFSLPWQKIPISLSPLMPLTNISSFQPTLTPQFRPNYVPPRQLQLHPNWSPFPQFLCFPIHSTIQLLS